MELKYLFGSKMLKLNNCRDEDWLTFVNEHPPEGRIKGHRRIPFYNTIIKHFVEGKGQPDDYFNSSYLYQLSYGFFDGDKNYPFKDFNVFEHKEVWIEQLKGYMNSLKSEQYALSRDVLPKPFYHIVYQYQMILEDTHFISEEAKVDVQKIHDFEMPKEYFYTLKDMINSL